MITSLRVLLFKLLLLLLVKKVPQGQRIVWLLRHTESEANAGQRTADEQSNPLSPLGEDQAQQRVRAIGPRATRYQATKIVCSTFKRARQAVIPLATYLGVEVEEREGMEEFSYLSMPDTTLAERASERRKYWCHLSPDYKKPDRESLTDFLHRVHQFRLFLFREEEHKFLIYSGHEQFWLGLFIDLLFDLRPDHLHRWHKIMFYIIITSCKFPLGGVVEWQSSRRNSKRGQMRLIYHSPQR